MRCTTEQGFDDGRAVPVLSCHPFAARDDEVVAVPGLSHFRRTAEGGGETPMSVVSISPEPILIFSGILAYYIFNPNRFAAFLPVRFSSTSGL
jgi:hypothetical protein